MEQFSATITTDKNILRLVSAPTTMPEVLSLNLPELMGAALEKAWLPPVGLAAIQICAPLRFAFHYVHEDNDAKEGYVLKLDQAPKILLNPVIEEVYNLTLFPKEGCLSIPGESFNTWRYTGIVYTNDVYDFETGKTSRVRQSVNGFEAVVIQHEVGHMNGELACDHTLKPALPGRNDACNCGSGKKFKKCCEGKKIRPVPVRPALLRPEVTIADFRNATIKI